MKREYWRALASLAATVAMMGMAQAGVVLNGGFETGIFDNWSTLGATSIQTSTFGTGPSEGSNQALMRTGSGAAVDTSIETFLGLSTGRLDELSTGNATDGSAIKQTIAGNAGDVVSFQWNFLTNELSGAIPFNDFAFWSLANVQNGLALADTTLSALSSSATEFDDETGYFTTSYMLTSSGSFILGFGVMNTGDVFVESGLLIDNVTITPGTPIPEPTSLVLLAIGSVGAMGGVRRRIRRGLKGSGFQGSEFRA